MHPDPASPPAVVRNGIRSIGVERRCNEPGSSRSELEEGVCSCRNMR
jgi:hypothetical protein